MIYIAKILALLLGLTVISKTYVDYRKKRENIVMLLFWTITWLAIILFALDPILVDKISSKIGGNGSGLGNFLGMAFVLLFFVTYRVYVKANRIEKTLGDLARKTALQDLKK